MPSGRHADEQKCNTLLGMVKTTVTTVTIITATPDDIIIAQLYHRLYDHIYGFVTLV
jgi:hypothetical protein